MLDGILMMPPQLSFSLKYFFFRYYANIQLIFTNNNFFQDSIPKDAFLN
jgi:hypothetical protein